MTGDDPALVEIRAYLPRFRSKAFGVGDGLLARFREARLRQQTTYPHAAEVLEELRRHARLALVTNGTSDFQRRKLALSGLEANFDFVVASCDIGSGKPEPAIFERALDALGVTASQAVMVGNDKEKDIDGAANAGIRAIWIQHGGSNDDARADLGDLRQLPELIWN